MKTSLPFLEGLRRRPLELALVLCAAGLPDAHGLTVGIDAGSKALFLQVGAGTMTGGNFSSGGTPGNNTTVDSASVTVPSAQLGSGTAQAMTTSSTVTASAWNGSAFCNAPATTGEVYVAGFYRAPGNAGTTAALSVSTPSNLTNASGNTLAFSSIAWTSSGNGDVTPTIPSGAFTGGAQTLLTVTRNTWFESCLAFRYLNTQLVPAGTFTGRATFTLALP